LSDLNLEVKITVAGGIEAVVLSAGHEESSWKVIAVDITTEGSRCFKCFANNVPAAKVCRPGTSHLSLDVVPGPDYRKVCKKCGNVTRSSTSSDVRPHTLVDERDIWQVTDVTEEDWETTEGEAADLYDKLMEMAGWKVTDKQKENDLT
jgi:ribosomal protein L40E